MPFLMALLSQILASTLVAMLAGMIITVTFAQTVLSSHYLESKLASTNSYARLSDELNKQIGQQAINTGNPQLAAQLGTIITPTVLQTKINGALDQTQAYYRGSGPAPTIDLTDLATQAEAKGIPVPADSGINKPIPLATSQRARGLSKTYDQVRLGTIVASFVLAAGLLLVSWERHKWAVLPDVAIVVGGIIGLIAGVFAAIPHIVTHTIHFDTKSNAFAHIGTDLAANIAHDLSVRFGIFAAIFLVIGIAGRVWVARRHTDGPMPLATALKTGYQKPTKLS